MASRGVNVIRQMQVVGSGTVSADEELPPGYAACHAGISDGASR